MNAWEMCLTLPKRYGFEERVVGVMDLKEISYGREHHLGPAGGISP